MILFWSWAAAQTGRIPPVFPAQDLDLLGRANDPIQARRFGQPGQAQDLGSDVGRQAHLFEVGAFEAGENGDPEQNGLGILAALGRGPGRFGGLGHHLPPARSVDGHHLDAVLEGRPDRSGHGVGDVVELEVEEDILAQGLELAEERRALGREELQPDLERPGVLEPADEGDALLLGLHVEGDDDAVGVRWGHGRSFLPLRGL
jgi:hypothetical protein